MQNGLYVVRFETALGQGSGVVVVRDGSIGGGDTGTYYRGSYAIENRQATATITVGRYLPGWSVLGVEAATFTLRGPVTWNSAALEGQGPGGIPFKCFLTLIP
jgi:hypothetical protein